MIADQIAWQTQMTTLDNITETTELMLKKMSSMQVELHLASQDIHVASSAWSEVTFFETDGHSCSRACTAYVQVYASGLLTDLTHVHVCICLYTVRYHSVQCANFDNLHASSEPLQLSSVQH